MSRAALDDLLAQIRSERERTLEALTGMAEDEFSLPTDMQRWTDVRRVLLRFGDHMREHANQIAGVRAGIGSDYTTPQRMLAEGEMAWGKLLGTVVGLSDEELRAKPPDGGWSVQEVLEHILVSERNYRNAIMRARGTLD